ncbi:hypothetical protein H310_11243 [Aphanomyces invadans]|uniref:SAPK-interacting protein 1 Pleckstrin-homology domain-containing protein n=1 Tax=Aphanomyces invadans TaxID=157072 RepID=A0A024TMY5_9STRA|nr:hypothetical protein H310_11243 [Aphanomyces invadans]ETV95354.1 hypothetical protein H310_11243 [Aphanomyces invadans]|eukprot:XP_008876055.1 hypothetical protein H310_11243 [Aphanomyces invadans]
MQLSEVSELRSIVSLMRLNACNSPRFHDRQDSEVDRIYNSSPKVASYEMRSSWMDRPSIQLAVPSVAPPQSQTQAQLPNDDVVSCDDDASVSSFKAKPPAIQENKQTRNDTKDALAAAPNGKPKVVVFDAKKASSSNADAGAGEPPTFVFEREDVPSFIQSVQTSLLDAALRGAMMINNNGNGPSTMHKTHHAMVDAPMIPLQIYLPNRAEMQVELYEISTVEEAIQTILMTHLQEGKRPQLYYGHPECYDLRLHEANGYPDEDFPALDRSRKIKNFGDNGNHEFCLCERSEACPPPDGSPPSSADPSIIHRGGPQHSIPPGDSRRIATSGDKNILKIIMPNENHSVIPIKDGTTGKDLLPMLKKKHRLPMLDEYILKVSEADKLRLDLPSEIIDLETNLKPLGLQEVTLARKVYADAPAPAPPQSNVFGETAVESAEAINKNVRPPPSTFMYNDVKAAMYKEWTVIKTNKFGKRQHRMLGVDSHKVYNSKVGERAMISRTNIKVAERPISSITWLRFLPGPCDFQIQYSQPDEETIDYSAASAYECAEIVAKIKYIQEMHKRK